MDCSIDTHSDVCPYIMRSFIIDRSLSGEYVPGFVIKVEHAVLDCEHQPRLVQIAGIKLIHPI